MLQLRRQGRSSCVQLVLTTSGPLLLLSPPPRPPSPPSSFSRLSLNGISTAYPLSDRLPHFSLSLRPHCITLIEFMAVCNCMSALHLVIDFFHLFDLTVSYLKARILFAFFSFSFSFALLFAFSSIYLLNLAWAGFFYMDYLIQSSRQPERRGIAILYILE